MGLPAVVRGERPAGAIDIAARAPVQDEPGPSHGVAVEEIGDTPRPPEPGRTGRQDGERTEAGVVAPRAQYLEHCPDETVDPPRITDSVEAPSFEYRGAQRAGEREVDVRGDTVAGTRPRGAERSGELQGEPPAHAHSRHGDPFWRHRVHGRLRQHLGQHRCERLHTAGA